MKKLSLLRRLEYKRLSRLRIDGRILDVGGSRRSGYHNLITGEHTFVIGNIDPSYEVDATFDAQERWPYGDASFEGVLCMNLLEHLYGHRAMLGEAHRVLASGGMLVGAVPFMFNIHGSPSDYFRYTRFALEQLLQDAGFTDIRIEELGTGAFSVIAQILGGALRWGVVARLLAALCRGIDRLLAKLRPNNLLSTAYYPLGYYFEARK